jgi:hypothetical protein
MAMPPRPRIAPTDDWQQIELLARTPGQRIYELIRRSSSSGSRRPSAPPKPAPPSAPFIAKPPASTSSA